MTNKRPYARSARAAASAGLAIIATISGSNVAWSSVTEVLSTHSAIAAAGPVPVIAYDITETPLSGFGGWAHAYDGTITDTGRRTGPQCQAEGTTIAEYTKGSGTLNDGVTDAANIDSTQLLCVDAAADGAPVNPVVKVRFGAPVFVDSIVIHGGGTALNIYPGSIESATISVGAAGVNITSTPTGLPNDAGALRDDLFDLTANGLSSTATTEVTVSDITSASSGFPLPQTAIAEITVEGRPSATAVDLDIRPLSKRNVINLSSRLPVPLAILSSASLDVRTIDVPTLRFGHNGDEDSLRSCTVIPDINRDRRPDLACLATIKTTGFMVSDTEGVFTGRTKPGADVIGRDDVVVRR